MNSRNTYLAFKSETTPGTAITSTTGIVYVPIKQGSGFELDYEMIEPDETRGNRADVTAAIQGVVMYKGKAEGPWYNDDSVAVARIGFGKHTVTQPDAAGNPLVYQSVLLMENTTPKTSTIWENVWDETAQTRRFAWGAADKFGLKFAIEKGLLEWDADLIASAKALQSGAPPTPTWTTLDPFAGWKAIVTKGGVAYLDLTSFQLDINNNIKPFYGSTGTQEPNRLVYGKFGTKGKAVAYGTRAAYETMQNDTAETFKVEFTGPLISGTYYEKVTIDLPKVKYKAALDRSKEEVMINFDLSAIYDPTTGSAVKMTVINRKASTYY